MPIGYKELTEKGRGFVLFYRDPDTNSWTRRYGYKTRYQAQKAKRALIKEKPGIVYIGVGKVPPLYKELGLTRKQLTKKTKLRARGR